MLLTPLRDTVKQSLPLLEAPARLLRVGQRGSPQRRPSHKGFKGSRAQGHNNAKANIKPLPLPRICFWLLLYPFLKLPIFIVCQLWDSIICL